MSKNKSSLLIDETPLQVLPTLAVAIGLNEAIFVQQLHWLLNHSGKAVAGQEGVWIYNTIEEWHSKYPFWSARTIDRIIKGLKELSVLRVGRFNKMAIDQTRWYSIDYDVLNSLSPITTDWRDGLRQNGVMTLRQNGAMLPKNKNTYQREEEAQSAPPTTEITVDTKKKVPKEKKATASPPSHPFITAYREQFKRFPNAQQMAELSLQPTHDAAVNEWKAVLKEWAMSGWNFMNVKGQLERFSGKGNKMAPPRPVGDVLSVSTPTAFRGRNE